MTVLHLIAIVFMILYFLECRTSRMYKRILDDLLKEQTNDNRIRKWVTMTYENKRKDEIKWVYF